MKLSIAGVGLVAACACAPSCAFVAPQPQAGTPSLSPAAAAAGDVTKLPAVGAKQLSVLLEATGAESMTTRGGAKAPPPAPASNLGQTAKVGFYFFLWYAFNVVYNLTNKVVLNNLPLPWTTSVSQLGIGLLFVFPVWLSGIRKTPKISVDDAKAIAPIAVMHTTGHIMTVVSLGAGAVSFTHIVKAAEPFFSTIMSAIFLKSVFRWQVYATLVPIVAGVSLASMTELSFSWLSFLPAMGSNTAFSLRAIFSKKAMTTPRGENMTAPNLYSVITIMSFIGALPFAALVEGHKVMEVFEEGIAKMGGPKPFWGKFMLAGLMYYLYNEVAFLALNSVHPITHAVGNTIKRVVIVLASVAYFRTPMRPLAILGSTIAILGTLLYSLAKNYFPNKEENKN